MGKERIDFGPPIKGVVTARNCERCGHHEVGITTEEGQFVALRPGMVVEIVEARDRHSQQSADCGGTG
jgi:hypothetical protein